MRQAVAFATSREVQSTEKVVRGRRRISEEVKTLNLRIIRLADLGGRGLGRTAASHATVSKHFPDFLTLLRRLGTATPVGKPPRFGPARQTFVGCVWLRAAE